MFFLIHLFSYFAEKWNCRVKIRNETHKYDSKPTETHFGPVIYDPNSVQTTVENAQKSALKQAGLLKFSKDVICVDIRVIKRKNQNYSPIFLLIKKIILII